MICERPRSVCTQCPSCRDAKCPGSNRRVVPSWLELLGDFRCEDCKQLLGTYGEAHRETRRVAWHRKPIVKKGE